MSQPAQATSPGWLPLAMALGAGLFAIGLTAAADPASEILSTLFVLLALPLSGVAHGTASARRRPVQLRMVALSYLVAAAAWASALSFESSERNPLTEGITPFVLVACVALAGLALWQSKTSRAPPNP